MGGGGLIELSLMHPRDKSIKILYFKGSLSSASRPYRPESPREHSVSLTVGRGLLRAARDSSSLFLPPAGIAVIELTIGFVHSVWYLPNALMPLSSLAAEPARITIPNEPPRGGAKCNFFQAFSVTDRFPPLPPRPRPRPTLRPPRPPPSPPPGDRQSSFPGVP